MHCDLIKLGIIDGNLLIKDVLYKTNIINNTLKF